MASEPPKAVSSRLLTMKFMQRAVASASSFPDTDPQTSKKRKLDHSPSQGRVSALIDQASIQAALEVQESKRQAALAKHSTFDTHWVLNTILEKSKDITPSHMPLDVVYVGYGELDSSIDSGGEENALQHGRTSSRKPKTKEKQKPKSEKPTTAEDGSSEVSVSDCDDSSSRRKSRHSSDGLGSQERSSRSHSGSKSKLDTGSIQARDFREKRKRKEIRLNKITSISSGGAGTSPLTCYNCKQPGHRASNCPRGSQFSSRNP